MQLALSGEQAGAADRLVEHVVVPTAIGVLFDLVAPRLGMNVTKSEELLAYRTVLAKCRQHLQSGFFKLDETKGKPFFCTTQVSCKVRHRPSSVILSHLRDVEGLQFCIPIMSGAVSKYVVRACIQTPSCVTLLIAPTCSKAHLSQPTEKASSQYLSHALL